MYLLEACTPVIPFFMLVPVIFGAYLNKAKPGHLFDKNAAGQAVGFVIGSVLYVGVEWAMRSAQRTNVFFEKNLLYPLGIFLPVAFGMIAMFLVMRTKIRFFNFSLGAVASGFLYLLFSAFPIALPITFISLRFNALFTMLALLTPVLFGLWLLANEEYFTWKYYVVYVVLSMPLSLALFLTVLLFSSM